MCPLLIRITAIKVKEKNKVVSIIKITDPHNNNRNINIGQNSINKDKNNIINNGQVIQDTEVAHLI